MNSKILFVVAGRFGKTLIYSKLLPILEINYFQKIYVFCEEAGIPLYKVEFITLEKLLKIKNRFLRRLIRVLYEPFQLFYYTCKLKPTAINSYQLVPKAWYTVLVCRICEVKSIVSSVGGLPEIQTYLYPRKFWQWVNIIVLKKADIVTTKGKTVSDFLIRKGIDEKKITTFNGAVNLEKFKKTNNDSKDIDILFVGQLTELKGPDRVLEVVRLLKRDFSVTKVVFLGSGYLKARLKAMITENNLGDVVSLKGYIDDTPAYYGRAKLLLMPSKTEGLATSMLEAMACGCVPVVSNVGCINEAAIHDFNSKIIERYDDIFGFYKASSELLSDESKRKLFSKNSRNLVSEKYSPIAQSKIFSNIISRFSL
jgi:glycosyltransferase involved in cell wall biosynthesis